MPGHPSLNLVLVGGMGSIGDNLYRLHQPAAVLAARAAPASAR